MRDQGDKIAYKTTLELNLRHAKQQEKEAYDKVVESPTLDNISNLNNARLNVLTAKSRIENVGKNRDVLDEYHLPNNY